MKNTELLKKIQQANEENSFFEAEVSKKSWKLSAIVGVILAIAAFVLELILWEEYNFGIFLIITAIFTFKFLFKYKLSREKCALVYGILFLMCFATVAVLYFLTLFWGW